MMYSALPKKVNHFGLCCVFDIVAAASQQVSIAGQYQIVPFGRLCEFPITFSKLYQNLTSLRYFHQLSGQSK